MPLLSPDERQFMQAIAELSYANPFLPKRIELEHLALGDAFVEGAAVWSKLSETDADRPNIRRLYERSEALAEALRERLSESRTADPSEWDLYEDLVNYVLYHRYRRDLADAIGTSGDQYEKALLERTWERFLDDFRQYFALPGRDPHSTEEPAHLFACFFQVRRAFHHIFYHIIGGSMPAARLRAAVWQSIFTHDMRRYRRTLYRRMDGFTTLITGPSGTGKELVARAIGFSRYVPFDMGKRSFVVDFAGSFHAVNLSALSSTLIESELFGHCRGAFTGAIDDRSGWLDVCGPLGTVFLDEIGELDVAVQVKLLRVLQTRTFQRLGETTDRRSSGKIIAATNQDLGQKIREGSFRSDFYYRLCSDIITTPTLREQLADAPDELGRLVRFLARRLADEDDEKLAAEVTDWITNHLGPGYPWPGNIRELEQCVANVAIRNQYRPDATLAEGAPEDPRRVLASSMIAGKLTAQALLEGYCTLIYHETGSYEQTAERLNLDRRTVKSKIDRDLLASLAMREA